MKHPNRAMTSNDDPYADVITSMGADRWAEDTADIDPADWDAYANHVRGTLNYRRWQNGQMARQLWREMAATPRVLWDAFRVLGRTLREKMR